MKIVADTEKKTIALKPGNNSQSTAEEKIKFIQVNFPEALKCNPFLSPAIVDKIKFKMFEAGLYRCVDRIHQSTTNEAIVKYILKAQGIKKVNRTSKRANSNFVFGR